MGPDDFAQTGTCKLTPIGQGHWGGKGAGDVGFVLAYAHCGEHGIDEFGGAARQQSFGIVIEGLGQQQQQLRACHAPRGNAPIERAIRQRSFRHPPFAKFFERIGKSGAIDLRGRTFTLFERALQRGLALYRGRCGRRWSRYGIVGLRLEQPATRLVQKIGIDASLAPPVERAFQAFERRDIARIRGIGMHHYLGAGLDL